MKTSFLISAMLGLGLVVGPLSAAPTPGFQAAPEAENRTLVQARRDLRISAWTVERIRKEMEALAAQPGIDPSVLEDYSIYRSDLPQSGSFNLLLVVKFAKTEDLAPNKARYDAFMAKWGEERNKATTERAQRDYPGMRELTGQYYFRKIELKK